MKPMIRALAAMAAALVLATSVQAADLELYIRNKPFQGQVVTKSGRLFAPLDGVLEALGYSWRLTGERVEISRNPGGGPMLPTSMLDIVYEGDELQLETMDFGGGRAMVDVKSLAEAMKLSYKTNPNLGTADLNVPVSKGSVGSDWGNKPPAGGESGGGGTGEAGGGEGGGTAPAGGGAQAGGGGSAEGEMIETDGNNKDSPIQIVATPFSDSTTPGARFVGEVRVSTTIKNGSDKDDLEKVKLHLKLVNMAGETVQEWTQDIGTLKAGQEYAFTPEPPIWFNYNQIKVEPKVIVEHQAVPKEEDKKDQGQGGK